MMESNSSVDEKELSNGGIDNTANPRRPKRVPDSQAKRRMEAMTSGVDKKLAASVTAILMLYVFLTIGTWVCLESQDYRHEVIEHTSPNSSGSSSSSNSDGIEPKAAAIPIVPKSAVATVRAQDIPDIETLQHTFPVHATGDMELIDHPGIFLSNPEQIAKVLVKHPDDMPSNGKMSVPKFWSPTAYGPGGVREFLGNYGDTLITPEQASKIGSFVNGLETIYISVASYRDPECRPTVEDMFLRAKHPERLRVAIIEQRDPKEDAYNAKRDDGIPNCGEPLKPCSEDPEQMLCKYGKQVDVFVVPAILSVGPVFARHLANRMYRGEYFAMQVDSHVRFIREWDEDLVSQWKAAKNEMAVMTVYLSDITKSIDPVTFENRHPNRPIMCQTGYEGSGKMKHLRHGQQPEGIPGIHGEPTLHPFWAAGFSFARGHFVVQVPYDQFQPMVFQGEEIFMGLRGWTFGYDYYTPETSVAFHMYAIKENKNRRKKVKLFWENGSLYPGAAVQGMKRLNGIIGTGDPGDVFYEGERKQYGLGKVRHKDQFYKLYGIHTETQTVEENLCGFVGKPMQEMFQPHLRENRMGIDFSDVTFEYKNQVGKKRKASFRRRRR